MICLGATVSIPEPCDLKKNNLCFFYGSFLRTWPQSVSFHSTHLYSFSSLQSVPHAPMNPIPSYPRDTWVLFICCHCWKRNMHLVLLMHIDRISPGKHNCAWEDGRPLPQLHPLLLTFWHASSPMRGQLSEGPISRFWGLAISMFLDTCVWCICVVWVC